jgi:outer membrane protein assembly factor BamB
MVDHGTLYFGTGDGELVAIDAATGTERWRLQPSPATKRVHTPSAANGRIFAGTEGGGYIAVDAATHTVAWTGDLDGDDTGTAGVAGDTAFIGTPAELPGHLRAFDAQTGTLRWTADQPLLQFPTVADGMAFSATSEGLIAAIDVATGATRWTANIQGKVRPMAVAGSILYLGADQAHKVVALDRATGTILWSYAVDDGNDCCIAVAHGAVFVGTLAGTVYSIGGDGSALSPEPVAAASPTPAPPSPSPSPAAVAELSASVVWSTSLDGNAFAPICQIAVDPKGRIWAPEANTDRIAIFSPAGKLLEEWGESGSGPGQFDFTRTNGDGYGTLAFATDGSFFVLDVGNRRVQHFDAKRHFVGEWGSFGDGPGQFSDPLGIAVGQDGTVWVVDDRRSVVEHYRPDGTTLGSFGAFSNMTRNDGSNGLAIDGKGHLYVSQLSPHQVTEFEPGGKPVQVFGAGDFRNQPTQIAIDAGGRVFVTEDTSGGARGILVFGADGALEGSFVRNRADGTAMSFPAGIAIAGHDAIYVIDSDPGQARLMKIQLGG